MATMDKSRLPELHMYDIHDKFPPHFYYQVEAFSRIVWGENPEAEDDLDAGLERVMHFTDSKPCTGRNDEP